jgi:hypothetical protein
VAKIRFEPGGGPEPELFEELTVEEAVLLAAVLDALGPPPSAPLELLCVPPPPCAGAPPAPGVPPAPDPPFGPPPPLPPELPQATTKTPTRLTAPTHPTCFIRAGYRPTGAPARPLEP